RPSQAWGNSDQSIEWSFSGSPVLRQIRSAGVGARRLSVMRGCAGTVGLRLAPLRTLQVVVWSIRPRAWLPCRGSRSLGCGGRAAARSGGVFLVSAAVPSHEVVTPPKPGALTRVFTFVAVLVAVGLAVLSGLG